MRIGIPIPFYKTFVRLAKWEDEDTNNRGDRPPLAPTAGFANHKPSWDQRFIWADKRHLPYSDQMLDVLRDIRFALMLLIIVVLFK